MAYKLRYVDDVSTTGEWSHYDERANGARNDFSWYDGVIRCSEFCACQHPVNHASFVLDYSPRLAATRYRTSQAYNELFVRNATVSPNDLVIRLLHVRWSARWLPKHVCCATAADSSPPSSSVARIQFPPGYNHTFKPHYSATWNRLLVRSCCTKLFGFLEHQHCC